MGAFVEFELSNYHHLNTPTRSQQLGLAVHFKEFKLLNTPWLELANCSWAYPRFPTSPPESTAFKGVRISLNKLRITDELLVKYSSKTSL